MIKQHTAQSLGKYTCVCAEEVKVGRYGLNDKGEPFKTEQEALDKWKIRGQYLIDADVAEGRDYSVRHCLACVKEKRNDSNNHL